VTDSPNALPEVTRQLVDNMSTGVVISSIVNTLEIAIQNENNQSKRDLFSQSLTNFQAISEEQKANTLILEKLLESLSYLINHQKFYFLFTKNEGIKKLVALHKSDKSLNIKLLVCKVFLKILKSFGMNFSNKSSKKQIAEFMDCVAQEISENFQSFHQILHYLTCAGFMLLDIELTASFQEQLFYYTVPLLIATHQESSEEFRSQFGLADCQVAEGAFPEEDKIVFSACTYCLYILRYLYSIPKKRHFFRKVFPTHIYSPFVDVAQISNNLEAFQKIASTFRTLGKNMISEMQ